MKKYFEIVCILLLTSYLPVSFCSVDTILKGRVTDLDSKEPILFATVVLYQEGKLLYGVETDFDGFFQFANIDPGEYDLEVSYVGYQSSRVETVKVTENETVILNVQLEEGIVTEEVVIIEYKAPLLNFDNSLSGSSVTKNDIRSLPTRNINDIIAASPGVPKNTNRNIQIRGSRSEDQEYFVRKKDTYLSFEEDSKGVSIRGEEQYNNFQENEFIDPLEEGLSTFSIDVDRASYSNVRRFLTNGSLPPKNAVRVEEMINYFNYDYEGPRGEDPFAIHTHLTECPWREGHQLLHIGLQGERLKNEVLPPSNLVFLIDVSGSMRDFNKLPLLKASLKLLLNSLRVEDRVAIVTYAGNAGVALPSTSMKEKEKIIKTINSLGAGGSTAGAEGIKTAYKIALENFIDEGNNRVLLATDGDFNVGVSTQKGLEDLIIEKRKSGIFLSVLGFGVGNYQDGKMQTLANKGNGNHAYIDNISEAKKVLINEFAGTLFTIAKDVKIQIEFNPAYVHQYRLIGYENRLLAKEDFNDDSKDAGELGAGHTVTAIYEIIPQGTSSMRKSFVDPLKYQQAVKKSVEYEKNGELATIKFRYKKPNGSESKKIEKIVKPDLLRKKDWPQNIALAIQVAQFGNLLRNSKFKGRASYEEILKELESINNEEVEGLKELVVAASVAVEK